MQQKLVRSRTARKPTQQLGRDLSESLLRDLFTKLQEKDFKVIDELITLFREGETSPSTKASILFELMSYMYPKKKAIDINVSAEKHIELRVLHLADPTPTKAALRNVTPNDVSDLNANLLQEVIGDSA